MSQGKRICQDPCFGLENVTFGEACDPKKLHEKQLKLSLTGNPLTANLLTTEHVKHNLEYSCNLVLGNLPRKEP